MTDHSHEVEARWKHDGVRVIPGGDLDPNTAQTPGMDRKAAINFARVGAQKIWAGTVSIHPDAKTGAHHHGHLESVIYVIKGKARMRWGDRSSNSPPKRAPAISSMSRPMCRIRKSTRARTKCSNACSCAATAKLSPINLDIEPVEKPETVLWVDPIHRG